MIRHSLVSLAVALFLLPSSASAVEPPTLTLGAAATVQLVPPGPVTADGKRVNLTVVVVGSNGMLASGARFRGSSAKNGRFDPDCSSVRPGVYSCGYTAPERVATGEMIRLKVKLPGNVSMDATFPITLESSGTARINSTASPNTITLTEDPSSELSFTVRDSSGAPVDDLDLRAIANVGTIEDLRSTGPGTWAARYVPDRPQERPFPQLAVISIWDANNPGTSQTFQVLPLTGKVTFPVNTGSAGATVIFKVAGKTFPQVVADASGLARVPITVPPGVSEATVELVQTNGARSTQTIDLRVPSVNRIGLGGLPDYLPANGKSSAAVRVLVLDDRGRPASGEKVVLEASAGSISEARFLGDGVYAATYTSPVLSAADSVTIKASLAGEAAASQVTRVFGLEVPGPSSVRLTADPSQLTSSTKKSKLTAKVMGPDGSPASKLYTVELRTADGPLRKISQAGTGTYTADLSVDWKVKTRVQATARMRGNKQAVDQLLVLPMSDAVVTSQKMPLSVLSLDRYGNPVSSVAVNCSATGGGSVTSSAQTDAFGMTTVVFTASALGGYATVACEAGGNSYTAPLWQTPDPMDDFSFPIGGGQRQGSLLARWSKLRASVDLSQAKGLASSDTAESGEVTGSSSAWGSEGSTSTDSGSVGAAGEPANIQVSAVPNSVPATGGTVNLVVRVTDATGILVPGTNVILITNVGSISSKTDNGDGTFSAMLTVPPKSGADRIQVTATRPAGDIAGFVAIGVGGAVAAGPSGGKKPPKPVMTSASSGDRMERRSARVWGGWTPGSYTYDSNPCSTEDGPCEAPADSTLDSYDFLKAEVRAPTVGTFSLGGEWFPFQDWIGFEAGYTRASYSTDFVASTGDSDSHCATHFCDSMNYVHVGAQGRFSLLKDRGPLDILVRVGPHFQDVIVFWRRDDGTGTGEKEPRFQTIGLAGLRVGAGLRYTVTPKLQPHFNYNITFGIQATLEGTGFPVPGVTNHHLVGGLTVFPWQGLMLDVSYVGMSRSLGLSYDEAGVIQRGTLSENSHSLRLSAGWAF